MKLLKSISSLSVLLLLSIGTINVAHTQEVSYTFVHSVASSDQKVQDEPYKSEFFRTQGIPKVTVHTTTGNIEVFQNPDLNGVKVDLFLERSFSLWSGQRSLDNYRIILQQQGDHIIASVEDRRSGRIPSDSNIKFNFVVQTPKKVSTILRTFNGDIHLENVEGHHFVQNQSGNISINHSRGEIRAVSTVGDIDLDNLEGSIWAKTVNGNVNVFSNAGEIRIRSVAGNIIASEITGTLVSATTSGNIYADFKDVSTGIKMETLSGNIELSLPTSKGYEIEGSAQSYDLGGINNNAISEKFQNHGTLNVVIREGGVPVYLSTLSGRIRVTE